MKLVRSLLIATLGLLATTSVAVAQTTPVGPSTQPPAPGVTSVTPADLDLPLKPPAREFTITPIETPPPGDDPRDTPPPTLYGEEMDSENDTIIYVLDVSCSMGWDTQSYTTHDGQRRRGPRIDRAKAELSRSITGLSDNFKFNVFAYDCSTRRWSGDLQEATDPNKQRAIGWISGLRPTGATGTGPATSAALASSSDNKLVVLLTDGAPNCGASGASGHRSMIRNANTQGAVINVFGIAATGSYRAFCQAVASDNSGAYFDVP